PDEDDEACRVAREELGRASDDVRAGDARVGAHRDPQVDARSVDEQYTAALDDLAARPADHLAPQLLLVERRGARGIRCDHAAGSGGETWITVAPSLGDMVIPRRAIASGFSPTARRSVRSRTRRMTSRISISAKLAPRQRRTPPPNGIHE